MGCTSGRASGSERGLIFSARITNKCPKPVDCEVHYTASDLSKDGNNYHHTEHVSSKLNARNGVMNAEPKIFTPPQADQSVGMPIWKIVVTKEDGTTMEIKEPFKNILHGGKTSGQFIIKNNGIQSIKS
ncbi:unnamed protein product, partial [Didymodactylos carnosus]